MNIKTFNFLPINPNSPELSNYEKTCVYLNFDFVNKINHDISQNSLNLSFHLINFLVNLISKFKYY
jgi:hypothetical protein